MPHHEKIDLLKITGVLPIGKTRKTIAEAIVSISDPYVPFQSGVLKNKVQTNSDGTQIIYDTPYARYHWYGKLMVDPETGSPFARKDVEKVLTDRDMTYFGAPQRGPQWVNRALIDNKEKLTAVVKEMMKKNGDN